MSNMALLSPQVGLAMSDFPIILPNRGPMSDGSMSNAKLLESSHFDNQFGQFYQFDISLSNRGPDSYPQ